MVDRCTRITVTIHFQQLEQETCRNCRGIAHMGSIDFAAICCPFRGATTAEKLRGTKVWVPTPRQAISIRVRTAPPVSVRVRTSRVSVSFSFTVLHVSRGLLR